MGLRSTEGPQSAADAPLVSVCMPAYNAGRWIGEAIESVLAQTYENFELVISDNYSTDETLCVARSFQDARIHIYRPTRHLIPVDNQNYAVQLSRGEHVKFLHADDRLLPDCLERNVARARESPAIGLVFSRRRVLMESQDDAWLRDYGRPHEGFARLGDVNDGRPLFEQLLRHDLELNLVGEPTAAFVTRACLERVGLFNPRLRQISDLELWARIMLTWKVGFIDRELAEYRRHEESVTAENIRYGHDWLDRLWLLETLLQQNDLETYRDQVQRLRDQALRGALRAQVRRVARRRLSRQLLEYAAFRLRRPAHRPRLYPPLEVRSKAVACESA